MYVLHKYSDLTFFTESVTTGWVQGIGVDKSVRLLLGVKKWLISVTQWKKCTIMLVIG